MKIENYSFGEIKIGGDIYLQDLKILGEKVVPNWWRKQGHLLQLDDIKDILNYRPEVLIIGTGAYGVMEVSTEVEKVLKEKKIKYYILDTGSASKKFNQLIDSGVRIAGCFHLSC